MLMNDATQRALERDPTPRPVIGSILDTALVLPHVQRMLARASAERRDLRVLDWCAGAGPWASEFRRRFPSAVIWAVEIFGPDLRYLQHWADHPLIGDWTLALKHAPPGGYDLVIGNPAFSLLTAARGRHPGTAAVVRLLRVSPIVIALHTIEVLHRSEAGRWLARNRPPRYQLDIPAGINFRGSQEINPKTGDSWGADSRSYAAYVWLRDWRGPGWNRRTLPELPAEARAWRQRPGTETRAQALALGLPRVGDR